MEDGLEDTSGIVFEPKVVGDFAPGGEKYDAKMVAAHGNRDGMTSSKEASNRIIKSKEAEIFIDGFVDESVEFNETEDEITLEVLDSSSFIVDDIRPEIEVPPTQDLFSIGEVPRLDMFVGGCVKSSDGPIVLLISSGSPKICKVVQSQIPVGKKAFMLCKHKPDGFGGEKGRYQVAYPVDDFADKVVSFCESLRNSSVDSIGMVYFEEPTADVYVILSAIFQNEMAEPGMVVGFHRFWNYAGWENGPIMDLNNFCNETGLSYAWHSKGKGEAVSIVLKG